MTLTTQQLTERRKRVHASDAPAICGVSPWASPRDVWYDKVHSVDLPTTEAMDMGNRLEPVLLDACAEVLDAPLRRGVVRTQDIFGATLDAIVLKSDPRAHVEAKFRSISDEWGDPEVPNAVPADVLVQTAVQFHCAQTVVCWVPVMLTIYGRPKIRMYRVDRDQELVQSVLDKCRRFWEDNVLTNIEPVGTPPKLDILKHLNRAEGCVELTGTAAAEMEAWAEQRDALSRSVKAFTQRLDEATREVLTRLGSNDGVRTSNIEVTYKQHDRKGYEVQPTTYRKLHVRKARI